MPTIDPTRHETAHVPARTDRPDEAARSSVLALGLHLLAGSMICALVDGMWQLVSAAPLAPEQTPLVAARLRALCVEVARRKNALLVHNTRTAPDPTASPALVAIGARAYLGVPIVAEGEVVGACCLIDSQPRAWTAAQARALAEFACTLVMERELRRERERRRALEAHLPSIHRLERVSRLASGMAHDVANLLSAVQCNAQLALRDIPPDSPARESLRNIGGAACSAAALARQVLRAVADEDDGSEWAVVRLSDLAADLVAQLRPAIPHQIDVVLDLDPLLPPLLAAPGQLSQVVLNLLVNAVEAIGDVAGRIVVRTAPCEEGRVMLAVSDTGCGMDAHTQERLGERGYSTKRRGHGIGMASVRAIVARHGGAITVVSAPGQGTTISLTLGTLCETEGGEEVMPLRARACGEPSRW